MKVNNEIAQAIVAECMSAMDDTHVVDAIVSLHNGDTGKDAQIAAECLKRVMPDITPADYRKAASDVLRWYVDGDDLDYNVEDKWVDNNPDRF
jgi:hypothetical protein